MDSPGEDYKWHEKRIKRNKVMNKLICECGHFKYNHNSVGCVLCDCGDPCEDTPKTWDEALDIVVQQFKDIMLQRHLKYGPGNINAFGELGCIVRLSDKVERLKNWMNNPNTKVMDDESLDDTWVDAGNYPIIRMMYVKGWWDLPIEKEEELNFNLNPTTDEIHEANCVDILCNDCSDTWDAVHPLNLKKEDNYASNN